MTFSVITVCLNPGEKLALTLESVLRQSFVDLEIVVKDGGSRDGSVAAWQETQKGMPGTERVRVFTEEDRGI